MKLDLPGAPHLTYCTNIHRGESWPEVREGVSRLVTAVKAQVAPDRPFGVGLRLSARAAEALAEPRELDAFRALLAAQDLYVFTVNGFPYGPFHGQPVKEEVYRPDWLEPERLAYTDRLADLLARLLPSGVAGSISTVPGAYRARVSVDEDRARMAEAMLRHVATLHRLREERGVSLALALEPEPCCIIETVADSIRFFEDHLLSSRGLGILRRETGLEAGAAERVVREHLGVCFDACHMAVEFEEPEPALEAYTRAGVRIVKVQVSAGLQLGVTPDTLAALARFDDGVYLHQVVHRADGRLTRFTDLPEALTALKDEAGEARVHCHVPLFRRDLGAFESTQAWLAALLHRLRDRPVPHLEVETYTWDVLPPEHRGEDVVTAVARELTWTRQQLAA